MFSRMAAFWLPAYLTDWSIICIVNFINYLMSSKTNAQFPSKQALATCKWPMALCCLINWLTDSKSLLETSQARVNNGQYWLFWNQSTGRRNKTEIWVRLGKEKGFVIEVDTEKAKSVTKVQTGNYLVVSTSPLTDCSWVSWILCQTFRTLYHWRNGWNKHAANSELGMDKGIYMKLKNRWQT